MTWLRWRCRRWRAQRYARVAKLTFQRRPSKRNADALERARKLLCRVECGRP